VNVPPVRVVPPEMLDFMQHFKVLRPVVIPDAVLVMHVEARIRKAHDDAVLVCLVDQFGRHAPAQHHVAGAPIQVSVRSDAFWYLVERLQADQARVGIRF